MKKQYCIEWYTRSGRDGFKTLGYDLSDNECKRELAKKLRQKTTSSVTISWNYVGDDIPDSEVGEEHPYMGGAVRRIEMFGHTLYLDNEYETWRADNAGSL